MSQHAGYYHQNYEAIFQTLQNSTLQLPVCVCVCVYISQPGANCNNGTALGPPGSPEV